MSATELEAIKAQESVRELAKMWENMGRKKQQKEVTATKTPDKLDLTGWEKGAQESVEPPSTPEKAKAASAEPEPVPTGDSTASTKSLEKPRVVPQWRLADVSEQRMLKTGLRGLRNELAHKCGEALLELPKRQDGSDVVMRPGFLKRLLTGEFELKSCMESDVCAAQRDLRHLGCEQLLEIRAGTLDFLTESGSHGGHNNFLNTLDTHLFQKLAAFCLRPGSRVPEQPEAVHALGLRIALLRGGLELLAKELGAEAADALPLCWVIRLDESVWDGAKVALLHNVELQVDVLCGEGPDMWQPAAGAKVGVIAERPAGMGRDRRLHWEVFAFDPASDDILAELDRVSAPSVEDEATRRRLTSELSDAMKRRTSSNSDDSPGSARAQRAGFTLPPAPALPGSPGASAASPPKKRPAAAAEPPAALPPTPQSPQHPQPPSSPAPAGARAVHLSRTVAAAA